jgi:hypothetical protein
MRDVLEADRKPDGELRQDNVFRYVVATKERESRRCTAQWGNGATVPAAPGPAVAGTVQYVDGRTAVEGFRDMAGVRGPGGPVHRV